MSTESEKLLGISLDVLQKSTTKYILEKGACYKSDIISKAIDIFVENSIIESHNEGIIIFRLKKDASIKLAVVYTDDNHIFRDVKIQSILLSPGNCFYVADQLYTYNSYLYDYNALADAIVHDILEKPEPIRIMNFFGL